MRKLIILTIVSVSMLLPSPAIPEKGDTIFVRICKEYRGTKCDPHLLAAIAWVESSFYPYAINYRGMALYPENPQQAGKILNRADANVDIGLMQVNYWYWGRHFGVPKEVFLDPSYNLNAGAMILDLLMDRYPFWEAIGRYHSSRSWRMANYIDKVGKVYFYLKYAESIR